MNRDRNTGGNINFRKENRVGNSMNRSVHYLCRLNAPKDDPKIGPRNSPKNGLVVQGSHGPMFQSSFYPVLSTKRLVAKSILVPIFT